MKMQTFELQTGMKTSVPETKFDMPESPDIPDLRVVSFSDCKEHDTQIGRSAVQDKRRHKRFSVADMDIRSQMSFARKVKVINISTEGIMLKADRRLDMGNKYTLKIEYKDKTFIAKADVKWSLLVAGAEETGCNIAPLYLAGMQFTDSPDKLDREEIIRLIAADSKDVLHSPAGRQSHAELPYSNDVMVPDRHPTAAREHYPSDTPRQEIPGNPNAELSGEIRAKILDIYSRYKNKTLNYYEILCVDGFAGRHEIRKAYYTKVREFHPDRYSQLSSDMKEKLNDLFSYLNEAYEVLTNCQDRFEYNRSRAYHQPLNGSNIDLARREFEKGKLEFWNGCMSEAGKFFQNAIYLDNTRARYFFFHAKTLQNLGNLREAEKAIRNALKIDPANPDYLVEAGKIYYGLGLTYRAREKFEMALRIQPSNTKARQGLNDLGTKRSATVP